MCKNPAGEFQSKPQLVLYRRRCDCDVKRTGNRQTDRQTYIQTNRQTDRQNRIDRSIWKAKITLQFTTACGQVHT